MRGGGEYNGNSELFHTVVFLALFSPLSARTGSSPHLNLATIQELPVCPEDRWFPSQIRTINYLEVGTWIDFDVSDMVRQGEYDFILYPSSLGVNKDVKFASNEYWDATKRPKLTIQYVEWGVP